MITSFMTDIASPPSSPTVCDEVPSESAPPADDLSCPIKGMYRLLDLIMEQGNSGLGNQFFTVVHFTLTSSPQLTKS